MTTSGTQAPPRTREVGGSPRSPRTAVLARGGGAYVGDRRPPGCLDAVFVRSYLAHARVVAVDAAPAREAPGVVAAFAAADLPELPAVPARGPAGPVPAAYHRPALARDRVRFVGEPLAVVLAEDRYLAEDAAEEVLVDLAELPAVVDPDAAAAAGAPQLFPGHPNVVATRSYGAPVDEALAAAPVVVELLVDSPRLAPTSMEPRAILAVPDGDAVAVFCSHQAPHRLRTSLAAALGLDPAAVSVTAPDVGGAFGAKSQTFAEYLVVVALARRLGRPVRWLEDRTEALTAATHGRAQRARLRLGADRDGRLLALDARLLADLGGYPDVGLHLPGLTGWVLSGPYRIPAVSVEMTSVVTNAAPVASYRGAGRPEAAYALERAMGELGRRLGLDPVELRRRNFIPPEEFPYRSPTGARYDSGRYASALDLALERSDYAGWRAEQRRRRAAAAQRAGGGAPAQRAGAGTPADEPLLGIGVASWLERSGGEAGSTEYARVEVTEHGRLVGRVGTSAQGQGHDVTFAQVLADALEVAWTDVEIVAGDTSRVARGTGAFASRSVQVGGSALVAAARSLLAAAAPLAAQRLGVPPEAVGYGEGVFSRDAGGPGASVPLAALGPLAAEEEFASPQAFPFGSYVAVVEVHPRTGVVRLLRLTAVDDCGTRVNPGLVDGQVVGSIAQGIGQALYEEARYAEDGQPLSANLLDYTLPTASEIPDLVLAEHVTPAPEIPLGTKGAGESGCIGTPPAVVAAVLDALCDYDCTGLQMPLTPQRVLACLDRPLDGAPAA